MEYLLARGGGKAINDRLTTNSMARHGQTDRYRVLEAKYGMTSTVGHSERGKTSKQLKDTPNDYTLIIMHKITSIRGQPRLSTKD